MFSVFQLIKDFDQSLAIIDSLIKRETNQYDEGPDYVNKTLHAFLKKFNDFFKNEFELCNNKARIREEYCKVHEKWLLKSRCIARSYANQSALSWDLVLLEMFEEDNVPWKGIGELIDQFFLESRFCNAIKERNSIAKEQIELVITGMQSLCGAVDILDISNGMNNVVFDSLNLVDTKLKKELNLQIVADSKVVIDCLKKLYSSSSIEPCFNKSDDFIDFNQQCSLEKFKNKDVVFALGFFDFVSDAQFIHVLKRVLKVLKSQGVLVIGGFGKNARLKMEAEWIWSMRIRYRTKKELESLLKKLPQKEYSYNIKTALQSSVFILTITKM